MGKNELRVGSLPLDDNRTLHLIPFKTDKESQT